MPTPGRSSRACASRSASRRSAPAPASAPSPTPTTTPWPRRPTGSTRPSASTGPTRRGRGKTSRKSSSPPCRGCTGSTTSGSTVTAVTCHPPSSKQPSTLPNRPTPPGLESNSPSLHPTQGGSVMGEKLGVGVVVVGAGGVDLGEAGGDLRPLVVETLVGGVGVGGGEVLVEFGQGCGL